jgi:hypothetical protein
VEAESGGRSADLAGFVGGGGELSLLLSDTCGEGGLVSSEISESSDDETGPSLTSMAVDTLEVSCIRSLAVLFIVGLDWELETSSDRKMKE